jgi:hypothetical protein
MRLLMQAREYYKNARECKASHYIQMPVCKSACVVPNIVIKLLSGMFIRLVPFIFCEKPGAGQGRAGQAGRDEPSLPPARSTHRTHHSKEQRPIVIASLSGGLNQPLARQNYGNASASAVTWVLAAGSD